MTNQFICRHCAASYPDLGALSVEDWARVTHALEQGSVFLAAAEARMAYACDDAAAKQWLDHLLACPGSWTFSQQETEALDRIDHAFAAAPRPEHFTNYEHCDECREHDEVLRANTRETIGRKSFGTFGWDPVGFCEAAGLLYYFPALTRYALLPDMLHCEGLTKSLLSAIGPKLQGNALAALCTPAQRDAIIAYLQCLAPTLDNQAALQTTLEFWQA